MGGGDFRTSTSQLFGAGTGGASFFGTGAPGGYVSAGGTSLTYGSGGGGGGITAASITGGGAGAGAYCQKNIASPSSTYSYAIGAGGTGGAAGTSGGTIGGIGAGGVIIVTAYF